MDNVRIAVNIVELRANKEEDIVNTNSNEDLVARSVQRFIVISVNLRIG